MKPRKVIVEIEMLTDWTGKEIKQELLEFVAGDYYLSSKMGEDFEVRVNVIRDTKRRKK